MCTGEDTMEEKRQGSKDEGQIFPWFCWWCIPVYWVEGWERYSGGGESSPMTNISHLACQMCGSCQRIKRCIERIPGKRGRKGGGGSRGGRMVVWMCVEIDGWILNQITVFLQLQRFSLSRRQTLPLQFGAANMEKEQKKYNNWILKHIEIITMYINMYIYLPFIIILMV